MVINKKLTILVVIALILAITAISLRVLDSNEVPTTGQVIQAGSGAGQVGINIQPAPVEDRLAEQTQETQP